MAREREFRGRKVPELCDQPEWKAIEKSNVADLLSDLRKNGSINNYFIWGGGFSGIFSVGTFLHWAIFLNKDISVIEALLKEGSSLTSRFESTNKRYDGKTAIKLAQLEKNEAAIALISQAMKDKPITDLQIQVKQLQTEIETKNKQVRDLQNQAQIKDKQITELQTQFKIKDTKITDLETQVREDQTQFEIKDTKITDLETQVREYQTQFETKDKQVTDLQTQIRQYQPQFETKDKQVIDLQTLVRQYQTVLEINNKQVTDLQTQFKQYQTEIEINNKQVTDLQTQKPSISNGHTEAEQSIEKSSQNPVDPLSECSIPDYESRRKGVKQKLQHLKDKFKQEELQMNQEFLLIHQKLEQHNVDVKFKEEIGLICGKMLLDSYQKFEQTQALMVQISKQFQQLQLQMKQIQQQQNILIQQAEEDLECFQSEIKEKTIYIQDLVAWRLKMMS